MLSLSPQIVLALLLTALAAAPAKADNLRAELHMAQPIVSPQEAILVRFSLFNGGGEPIDLELPGGAPGDPLALPMATILGPEKEPSLFLQYEAERPVPLRATATPATEPLRLRLAPRAAIGAELDLRDLSRTLRYSGRYTLEWRPLGGSAVPATLSFRVDSRKDVVMITDFGKVTFALDYDRAPQNVENFLGLARDRYYDGSWIHRIIPGYILQGGAPGGNRGAARPDGKTVPAEFHAAPFEAGSLAMALREGDANSASSQFFVTLGRVDEFDGRYTMIGSARDEESLRTLQRLAALPTDAEDRPLRPVLIRSMLLVESAPPATGRLEPATP